jgi:phage terminase large subunit
VTGLPPLARGPRPAGPRPAVTSLAADLAAYLREGERQAAYRDDPVLWAWEVLGVRLWVRQADICRAVARYSKVAVRSGHKVGKSSAAVILALWWCATRKTGRVIMTSSGGRQVSKVLWRELLRLVGDARTRGTLPDDFPTPAKTPDSGMNWADGRQIIGFSTDQSELMAGFSGAELLYILDEASGIEEPIFEAIEGNLAGGGRVVMFSNPTQTAGTFCAAFGEKREFWHCIHISSEDTPNVLEGREVVPGLAGRAWVEEKRKLWGVDSPLYQVRVRGNFPTNASDRVIAISLVDSARERWDEFEDAVDERTGRLEVGVDVARFGDDSSVIWPRRGAMAFPPIKLQGHDTQEVAGNVLRVVRELRRPSEPPARVKVDVIGVGAGVADALRTNARVTENVAEIEVVDVNVSNNATADTYVRLRDQLWFGVADWLKGGGMLPPNAEAESELTAPKFSFDAQGRSKVESKDEIKKVLHRSPDLADALALAVYCPPQRLKPVTGGKRSVGARGGGF